jgi:hypothetical protein
VQDGEQARVPVRAVPDQRTNSRPGRGTAERARRGPAVDRTAYMASHAERDDPCHTDASHTHDLRIHATQCPGGQGVVGSNPAVPTQVRGMIRDLGTVLGDHFGLVGSSLPLLDRGSSYCLPT